MAALFKVELGPNPAGEECVQLNRDEPGYYEKMVEESERYIDSMILTAIGRDLEMGKEPDPFKQPLIKIGRDPFLPGMLAVIAASHMYQVRQGNPNFRTESTPVPPKKTKKELIAEKKAKKAAKKPPEQIPF